MLSLSTDDLLRLESDICRAANRPSFWQDEDDVEIAHESGALGRMVKFLLNARIELGKAYEVSQADLAAAVGKPVPRFNEFLNGHPNGKSWTKAARKAVQIILLGEGNRTRNKPEQSDVDASEQLKPEPLTQEQLEIAERILHFFFPLGDVERQTQRNTHNERWYFCEGIKNSSQPESSLEVEAELRAFAFAAKTGEVSGQIIRVSGRDRFRQVDDGLTKLTGNGERTLDCLEAGISVVYVYLEHNGELLGSKQSAKAFQEFARQKFGQDSAVFKRLQLIGLSPTALSVVRSGEREATRFAGEYLCPKLRWQLYDRSDGQRSLIVSRWRSTYGPTAFAPDQEEVEDFCEWVKCFVVPNTETAE